LVGRGKALELILTADRLTADQALTLGLVDHMVPDLELPSFALDFARELAHRPAAVVRAVKEAVLRGLADGSAAGHQAERTGMAICRRMPTSSETRQQFVNSSAT
jgi:enoyl-CoA hydratase